jgi:hypothetical protein
MSSAEPQPRDTPWRKPSLCAAGECVEVATSAGEILVRSSTSPGRVLNFTSDEWRAFVDGVRRGEFDYYQ